MAQPRVNGTAKEKIAWLQANVPQLSWIRPDGNLPVVGYNAGTVVLGENGQWWIEEET